MIAYLTVQCFDLMSGFHYEVFTLEYVSFSYLTVLISMIVQLCTASHKKTYLRIMLLNKVCKLRFFMVEGHSDNENRLLLDILFRWVVYTSAYLISIVWYFFHLLNFCLWSLILIGFFYSINRNSDLSLITSWSLAYSVFT